LHKFTEVDAFVALDLAGAEAGSGPVRWARKVLQGGAKDLARSQTYTYAALQMRRGGASAGISAEAPARGDAVAAFVAEAAALVPDGTYLPDAAKGVTDADLAPLRDADPRTTSRLGAFAAACDGLSAAVAADAAVGLDGRTAVIEGFSATGPALAEAVAERGGRVVGLATAEGSLAAGDGFDPAALADAWTEHGDKALGALAGSDDGLGKPGELWGIGADVVFAGSKMGTVNHGVAEGLGCRALVPSGRLAFTSKALAVCRRGGVAAVPDFVALAGSTIAAWSSPGAGDDEVRAEITGTVSTLMADALASDDGPFLGACYTAETFLSTWQDELPFGRPLAS
jgi:glutamate dehydrogenase/leucine dehydrogenase